MTTYYKEQMNKVIDHFEKLDSDEFITVKFTGTNYLNLTPQTIPLIIDMLEELHIKQTKFNKGCDTGTFDNKGHTSN